LITIKGNGAIQTILVTKHLDANTKQPKVLLCYDFANGIIDEEEEILLQAKPKLITIETITLPKSSIVLNVVPKIGLEELKFDFPHTPKDIPIDEVPAHLKM
jgi:hypothetical protein